MQKTRIALMIAGALLTSSAQAAECPKVQPIEGGEIAPCGGLLVPPQKATEAITCLRADLPECEARAKSKAAQSAAEIYRLRTVLEAEQARSERLSGLLDTAAVSPQTRSTWIETATWTTGGVVVGIVIGILAASRAEAISF